MYLCQMFAHTLRIRYMHKLASTNIQTDEHTDKEDDGQIDRQTDQQMVASIAISDCSLYASLCVHCRPERIVLR